MSIIKLWAIIECEMGVNHDNTYWPQFFIPDINAEIGNRKASNESQ